MNPNIRTEIIEVVCNNTGVTEFSLGSLPDLRQAQRIISIEAFSVAQFPVAPSGKAVVNATVFSKSVLKLINRDNTTFGSYPLVQLSKTVNGTTIPELDVPQIDPEKSKITIGTAAALVLNEAWILVVKYEKPGRQG